LKYYINPSHFAKKKDFIIRDFNQNPLFKMKGRFFLRLKRLEMTDNDGNTILRLQKRCTLGFTRKYDILTAENQRIGRIKRTYGFFRPKFTVLLGDESLKLEGSFYQHDFALKEDDRLLAKISKQVFPFGDAFEIDVRAEEEEKLHLFLMVGLDQFIHEFKKTFR